MIDNRYWNATRVQNFVKALGGKPTKWAENIGFLANTASMSTETFLQMDPISYGITVWGYTDGPYGYKQPHYKIRKVLGIINYYDCYYQYCREIYDSWSDHTQSPEVDESEAINSETWNPARVSKFVKALGGASDKHDIEFLAAAAAVSREKFLELDPITYGMMIWGYSDGPYGYKQPSFRIRKVLGAQDYDHCYYKYCEIQERFYRDQAHLD